MQLFLSAFLFIVTLSVVEGSFSFGQDSSNVIFRLAKKKEIKIPSDTSAYCIIEMEDGLLLKGRIIGKQGNEIWFRDNNLGLLSIEKNKISFIGTSGADMYFLFYMKDGSRLHGEIIRQNATEVEIRTKTVSVFSDSTQKKVVIPLERIKEMRKIEKKDIRRKGRYRYPNMNASRYFFSPSAIPLNEDEGYFQSADVLINNFNFGITRNISLNSGAVLPFGLFVMPKYGYKVNDFLHVGGGALYAQTLLKYRKTNYKVGALYGLATLGNLNNNLTFVMGYAFSNVNSETIFFPKPIVMINGMLRISRKFALVGENMFLPVRHCEYLAAGNVCTYNNKYANIYGMRFMKEKVTVDLGLMHYPQDIFSAFPYLDFVIKF